MDGKSECACVARTPSAGVAKPWRNTTMQAEIQRACGIDFLAADRDELAALLQDKIHPIPPAKPAPLPAPNRGKWG